LHGNAKISNPEKNPGAAIPFNFKLIKLILGGAKKERSAVHVMIFGIINIENDYSLFKNFQWKELSMAMHSMRDKLLRMFTNFQTDDEQSKEIITTLDEEQVLCRLTMNRDFQKEMKLKIGICNYLG